MWNTACGPLRGSFRASMWRQSEDFIGSAQKKCVNVNYNGEFDQGKGKTAIQHPYNS